MPKFRIRQIENVLKVYEVEAENADAATEAFFEGDASIREVESDITNSILLSVEPAPVALAPDNFEEVIDDEPDVDDDVTHHEPWDENGPLYP